MQLELRGLAVWDSGQCARLDTRTEQLLRRTKHFVLVLPPGGLDCCKLAATNQAHHRHLCND